MQRESLGSGQKNKKEKQTKTFPVEEKDKN